MDLGNPSTSIIALNVNELNSPIKRQRVAHWIKKTKQQNVTICYLQETHLSCKDKYSLKGKGEKLFSKQMTPEKIGIAIFISDKTDFKTRRWTFYNNNGNNTSIRHDTYQYTCTQSGNTKIDKAATNRTKERN